MTLISRFTLTLTLATIPLAACGDNVGTAPDAAAPDAAVDAGPQQVTLQFAAKIGGTAFACGQSYANIGSPGSTYVAADFRFYVHDVKLVSATGAVPVTLDANDFQNAEGVALLDFEDGTASCQMGSAATHPMITGTVPPGTYTGISFVVGVPFAQNHLDTATAAPPLNVPALYWTWAGGHKFLKTDGVVGGNAFNLHLGSTGCVSTGPTTPPTTPCTNPNTIAVTLTGYTPATSTIVVDTAPVLADVDVSANTAATAPGCQSFPNDPECELVFPHLALPYGAAAAGAQTLFTVE